MDVARKLRAAVFALAAVGAVQCAQEPASDTAAVPAADQALQTDDEKMLYAVGLAVASNSLGSWKGELSEQEVELIQRGFRDAVLGREALVDMDEFGPKLNEYMQQRAMARFARQAADTRAGQAAFLEEAATAEGAQKTASGLVITHLVEGTGPSPALTDEVKVHYRGTLVDGTPFDNSYDRGEPVVRAVNGFIRGWQEALPLMRVGGKARLVIPPELAYGDRPVGQIPPGSALVFEVELLGIE